MEGFREELVLWNFWLGIWPSMFESTGSFFRSPAEIQSGPIVFDKSKLAVAFLTNLGVTWIRLVLKEKACKEILEP